MPIYRYFCPECNSNIDQFFEIKYRKRYILCDNCGGRASRIYEIGGWYFKKQTVGDLWDKEGISPVTNKNSKTKQANRKRIRKMREQSKIDIENKKRNG